jgi:hypothetical protein
VKEDLALDSDGLLWKPSLLRGDRRGIMGEVFPSKGVVGADGSPDKELRRDRGAKGARSGGFRSPNLIFGRAGTRVKDAPDPTEEMVSLRLRIGVRTLGSPSSSLQSFSTSTHSSLRQGA